MEQDIDKLLKLAQTIKKGVSVGEKIAKEGLGVEDLTHAPAAVEVLVALYNDLKHYKEIVEEAKDIDAAEGVKLLSEVLA